MGGSKKVKEELNDIYLGELRPQISQEEFSELPKNKQEGIQASQELYKTLVTAYQMYLTDRAVSDSLGERKKSNLKKYLKRTGQLCLLKRLLMTLSGILILMML